MDNGTERTIKKDIYSGDRLICKAGTVVFVTDAPTRNKRYPLRAEHVLKRKHPDDPRFGAFAVSEDELE